LIVRENGIFFYLITQQNHGLLSGELAARWGNETFAPSEHQMIMAASLHDLSWIEIDDEVMWNDKKQRPHDFTSLPLEIRLPMYENGLDETERLDPFASLLTSKHYCSFIESNGDDATNEFLRNERLRRTRLKKKVFADSLDRDLDRLQCWDNLSLYVCMNRPGCLKDEEVPWFKKGVRSTTKSGKDVWIHPRWLNERTISFDPFPFRESWSTVVPYYKMRKSLGREDPDFKNRLYRRISFVPA
jgi:hypothetical protein